MDAQDAGAPGSSPAGSLPESVRRAFRERPPGRLLAPGHPAGDFLDAPAWDLLEEREGFLRVRATLPERLRNPRGHLFGGFTPTFVDLVALCTFRAGREIPAEAGWLATLNMRVDYFEPVTGVFEMASRVVRRRGATAWIETRFEATGESGEAERGTLLAWAFTTLRETG